MRIAPLVAAGTLIVGLACGTAELTDGRRMPVVEVDALVSTTCARPYPPWPPHTDGSEETADTGCDEDLPFANGICSGDTMWVREDGEKLDVEATREVVEGWDGLVWVTRRWDPDDPRGEANLGFAVWDEAQITAVWGGTLYTLDADGRHDVVRDDLLVADLGDQLVFAYPLDGFDVVEMHRIGRVEERRVDPEGERQSCCCVSGPTRGATGGFLVAFLLATVRRQSTRAKPTT